MKKKTGRKPADCLKEEETNNASPAATKMKMK
jgi:hypothetical protein